MRLRPSSSFPSVLAFIGVFGSSTGTSFLARSLTLLLSCNLHLILISRARIRTSAICTTQFTRPQHLVLCDSEISLSTALASFSIFILSRTSHSDKCAPTMDDKISITICGDGGCGRYLSVATSLTPSNAMRQVNHQSHYASSAPPGPTTTIPQSKIRTR